MVDVVHILETLDVRQDYSLHGTPAYQTPPSSAEGINIQT